MSRSDVPTQVRIRTDQHPHRYDEIEANAEYWDCNKTTAIMKALEFRKDMIDALQRALDHPDMTPELAEILTTRHVTCSYEVVTDVKTGE